MIYINNFGQVYGVDRNLYIFKKLNYTIPFPIPVVFDCNELVNLIKGKTLSDKVTIQWGAQYTPLVSDIESKLYMQNTLDILIDKIRQIPKYCTLIESIRNLERFDIFNEAINVPADRGNSFINLMPKSNTRCIISIHKGLLPVNKSDIINANIYSITNRFNVIVYEIIKKKNVVINVYIKYFAL